MKKSLIALAVLAAAGAAQAQSTVTLYGIADVWLGSEKDELTTLGAKSTTKVGSGGFNGSRFGLQGSEDLGGGLKAVFKLEQGFNIDTGTSRGTGNTAFDRQSFVGLEGGFGSVTFGNVWSAMDDIVGAANGGFDSAFSPAYIFGSVHSAYEDNPRNAIRYTSPDFGGLTATVVHGLDENSAVSQDITDFNVTYGAGPLGVSLGYQVQNGATDTKLTLLNGSYDLGVAKVLAFYGQSSEGGAKSKDFQLGVDVPLSSALTVSASYITTNQNVAAGDNDSTGFGLALEYKLSKRTKTYAGIVSAKQEDTAGADTAKYRLYAVGLQHRF